MPFIRLLLSYSAVVVFAMLLVGCGGSIGYQPPVIPIRIGVDTNGNVSATISDHIATPIGTFDFSTYGEISLIEGLTSGRVLIARIDNAVSVFKIESDREFSVVFDKQLYKQVRLTQERDGNLILELTTVGISMVPTVVANVEPTPTVPPFRFAVYNDSILEGECAVVYWEVPNARSVVLQAQDLDNGSREVSLASHWKVCPKATQTIGLVVTGFDGQQHTASARIVVRPIGNPKIDVPITFYAEDIWLRHGECTKFHWDVENVREVYFIPRGAPGWGVLGMH